MQYFSTRPLKGFFNRNWKYPRSIEQMLGPSVHCSGAKKSNWWKDCRSMSLLVATFETFSSHQIWYSIIVCHFPNFVKKSYSHLRPITIVPTRAPILYFLLRQLWPGISSPPLSWINAHKRHCHICLVIIILSASWACFPFGVRTHKLGIFTKQGSKSKSANEDAEIQSSRLCALRSICWCKCSFLNWFCQ